MRENKQPNDFVIFFLSVTSGGDARPGPRRLHICCAMTEVVAPERSMIGNGRPVSESNLCKLMIAVRPKLTFPSEMVHVQIIDGVVKYRCLVCKEVKEWDRLPWLIGKAKKAREHMRTMHSSRVALGMLTTESTFLIDLIYCSPKDTYK